MLFNKLENSKQVRKVCLPLNALFKFNYLMCSVRLHGNISERFNEETGLKQGCVLSSVMFNIYMNILIDDITNTIALDIGITSTIDDEKLLLIAEKEKKINRKCEIFLDGLLPVSILVSIKERIVYIYLYLEQNAILQKEAMQFGLSK